MTRTIVANAVVNKEAIAFEDISYIHRLYQKGNGQGKRFRGMMNSWTYGEEKRQIEYKARWAGLPIIKLSRSETMGTSTICPICGESLLNGQGRMLYCKSCGYYADRDVTAARNIAERGRLRFDRSLPTTKAKGIPSEAMRGNPSTKVILEADGMKSSTQNFSASAQILPCP
jgi:putative transposase